MQSAKKPSSDSDFVQCVTRWALIEMLRLRVPRVLANDEAPQHERNPVKLYFQPIPLMLLGTAAIKHSAISVQYV
jgi:hypothetical protein